MADDINVGQITEVLNDKADDVSVVHKTGNETIGGSKKFTSAIQIGAISANDSHEEVRFADDSGQRVGVLRATNGASGGRRIEMFSAKADGTRSSGIAVSIDADGNEYHTAKTPDATSNTNHIATTAWVNNATVHKTGDEKIGGTKTFTAPYLLVKNTAGTEGAGISVFDANGKGSSDLVHYYTGGKYYTRLISRNATADKHAYVEVVVNDDGKSEFTSYNVDNMYAPTPAASSNSTNIATTAFVKSVLSSSGNGLATFSKGLTGYYKFNNGLIIQWGRVGGSANERAINFPTSFTNTNYAIVANPTTSGTTESFYSIATDESQKYTSSCVLRCSGHINTVAWLWIAIGY